MQGLVSHLRQGAAGSASAPRYWLTIGIPTVPRKLINTTYLTTTLETLLDELPADPLGEPLLGYGCGCGRGAAKLEQAGGIAF